MQTRPLLSSKESLVLVAAFLAFRLGLLGLFYLLTGGQEVASDVLFHKMIIDEPLGILSGTAQHVASYPPFQWLVEWPIYTPFSLFFSQMIAIRLLMISVEFFAFLVLIYKSQYLFVNKTMAIATAILFLISPHQYFATVLFVQEDIISQLVMLLAAYLLLTDRRLLAIATLVIGILVAKIFFVVPLFYVIFFHGKLPFTQRVLNGFLAMLPVVIVYYFSITNALNNGGDVPIRDFTPDAAYAANYWVLILKAYPHSLITVKNISLLLSVSLQLTLIAIFANSYRKQSNQIHPVILLAIPVAAFFATFYQHMPEYLLLLWPVVALLCTTIFQQLLLAAVFSLAWLPRIAHGLLTVKENFGSEAQARSEILGPFLELMSLSPEMLNNITLAAHSVTYTIMLVFVCRMAWKKNEQASRLPL